MPTYSVSQLYGQRVYRQLPQAKRLDRKGNPRPMPKVGKVHAVVFAPDGTRAVGLQVRVPDAVAMIKRPDVFVALDALEPVATGGLAIADREGATDKAAIKRLGLDWDRCVIWVGMDVRTSDGKLLGYVSDVLFDAEQGTVRAFSCTDGGAASALVGDRRFGPAMVKGLRGTTMVVDPEVAHMEFSGGLAGRAGAATAQAKQKAAELGEAASVQAARAGRAAGEAATKGGHALGRAIGHAKAQVSTGADAAKLPSAESAGDAVSKQLGRARGMFADFKREFDEASK